MDKSLSEESKDLLRGMINTEAWRIYEELQKQQIANLRVLATQRTTPTDDKHWFAAEAQGRENALSEIHQTYAITQ